MGFAQMAQTNNDSASTVTDAIRQIAKMVRKKKSKAPQPPAPKSGAS